MLEGNAPAGRAIRFRVFPSPSCAAIPAHPPRLAPRSPPAWIFWGDLPRLPAACATSTPRSSKTLVARYGREAVLFDVAERLVSKDCGGKLEGQKVKSEHPTYSWRFAGRSTFGIVGHSVELFCNIQKDFTVGITSYFYRHATCLFGSLTTSLGLRLNVFHLAPPGIPHAILCPCPRNHKATRPEAPR
jgi:hypothetical protein